FAENHGQRARKKSATVLNGLLLTAATLAPWCAATAQVPVQSGQSPSSAKAVSAVQPGSPEPMPSSAPPMSSATPAPVGTAAAPRPGGLDGIGYLNAQELASRCSVSEASSTSYCFAYIAAVTDTARAYEIWLGAREFCLPAGTSQAEIRRAFMTYVGAYPG